MNRILATAFASLLFMPAAMADSMVRVTLIDKIGTIDADSNHKLGNGHES